MKTKRTVPAALRRACLQRDGFRCQKCGRPKGKQIELNVHHIEAVADGGADELANLATLCAPCHNEWHEHTEGSVQFAEWLKATPMRWTARVLRMDIPDGLSAREFKTALEGAARALRTNPWLLEK